MSVVDDLPLGNEASGKFRKLQKQHGGQREIAGGKNTPLVFEGDRIDHGEVVGRQSRGADDDMRTVYALSSAWRLKRSHVAGTSSRDYWQAGKSVSGITSIEPAGEIVRRFAAAAGGAASSGPAPAAR